MYIATRISPALYRPLVMNPATPPLPAPTARRVPYPSASPLEKFRALVFVLETTEDIYSSLGLESWVHALRTVQPDLWVTAQVVHLDDENLRQMRRCLYRYLTTDDLEHPIVGPCAPLFARWAIDRQDDAILALGGVEADPLACPPAAYRLVNEVAAGNKEALEVYRATEPTPYQQPGSYDVERIRAAVSERLQALRDARGEPTIDPRSQR